MTAEQLELPGLEALVEPEYEPDATNGERFRAFHLANPHVADALEDIAALWFRHRAKGSAKAFVEALRWETGIRTEGDIYEINSTNTAFYARLLVARRPEWREALDLRRSEADDVDWSAAEWRRGA